MAYRTVENVGEKFWGLHPQLTATLIVGLLCTFGPLGAQDNKRLAPEILAPRPPSQPDEKALKEITANLERFWAHRYRKPATADIALFRAEERAVELWLPAEHKILGDIALAMTYWWNRDRAPWSIQELTSPNLMFETAMRMQERSRRLLLLRRAWYQLCEWTSGAPLSGENLRLAYETAIHLLHLRKVDEAREVVATALGPFSNLPQSPHDSMDFHELLGLRYLEVKLMATEKKQREGWGRMQEIYEEAKRAARVSSGPNYLAWQILAAQELIEIATFNCDLERLEQALRKAALTEADLLLDSPFGLNEDLLRAMFADVAQEEQLIIPLLRCGQASPPVAELTFERVLIRREAWRFRHTTLRAVASSDDAYLNKTLRSVVSTRRLQAQMQLRVRDDRLEAELESLPIPRELSPPSDADPMTIAWVELSSAVATMESNLTQAALEQWRQANASFVSNLLAEVRRALPHDGVLAVYFELRAGEECAQDRVLVMVVGRETAVRWKLLETGTIADSSISLATLARGPRGGTLVNEADRGSDALREIGKALIDPVESMFDGKKKIFLLTYGPLRLLPWQALIDQRGWYFGDRFELGHIQSASDLFSGGFAAATDVSGIVLVAPGYQELASEALEVPLTSRHIRTQFLPLPWAMDEVKAIGTLLYAAGLEFRVAMDTEATEDQLWKLRRPRVLHFAGHGFQVPAGRISFQQEVGAGGANYFRWPFEFSGVRGGARYRTGIALSDANKGRKLAGPDGLLTAAEVADLDLFGTELVVLSACETGYPIDEDATGPMDLALAFRQAGARSVVAAIWKVDDQATGIFMKALYGALIEGDSVVPAAQKARQAVRRTPRFSAPYFWAGFEVFGDNVTLR